MKPQLPYDPVTVSSDHSLGHTLLGDIGSRESVDLLHDPRSVRSMLAGCDDGRGAIYERFHQRLSCAAPHLEVDEIAECYRRFEFAACLAVFRLPRKWHMPASRWLMYVRSHGNPMCWLT